MGQRKSISIVSLIRYINSEELNEKEIKQKLIKENFEEFINDDNNFESSNSILLFKEDNFMITNEDILKYFLFKSETSLSHTNMKKRYALIRVEMKEDSIIFNDSKFTSYITNNKFNFYAEFLSNGIILRDFLSSIAMRKHNTLNQDEIMTFINYIKCIKVQLV